jgi:amino acid adenylation domain-containing protein
MTDFDHQSAEITGEVFLFPASFAQRRLWFLDQWEPGTATYNVPIAVRLTGSLDVNALERSLNAIVSRHEVLRTTFEMKDGQPIQRVAPDSAVSLRILDLTTRPHAEREAEAQRLVMAEAHRPFDLSQGPLLRAMAVRLADAEHVVLLTIHHIVFDGWSTSVLFRELAACYNAFTAGAPVPLSPLSIQYADFTIWQRDWLQGQELERELAYWRKQLSGALPLLQLATDHSRPSVQGSRGAHHPVRLSRGLTDRLTSVSRRERVTLFMTLLAAFQTLLYRYTEQEDILVGSAIAGRNQVELESLIGVFVNTLVLRTDLSGDPTFRELLDRVRDVTLGAYAHQDVPFEKLVEELHPERSLAHAPLCQAIFVFQNTPQHTLELLGLATAPFDVTPETAKFDLSLSLREGPGGLTGSFTYSTDLFEASTIARMATHFEILLEGISANPDRRLSQLPLLSDTERHQLLVEWNETDAAYPTHLCLHQLFEAQVAKTPHAIAVVCGAEDISYGALNARANQLARCLRARGVGPDVVVGVCLERSIDMEVALLGILKAGGAYVPLDPGYPQERLRFMLDEAAARVLVTESRLAGRLGTAAADLVCLDTARQTVASERGDNLESGATPESLAYVLFTSGSTGRPKGVMIPHRAVCNFMHWAQDAFPLTGDDRVLQRTPCGFDVSVWECYAPVLVGAQLIISPPGADFEPAQLVRTIAATRVTILQVVPSVLAQLLEEPDLPRCDSVRRVLSAGEALSCALQERFFERLDARLYNLYGPTETCIYSAGWTCRRGGGERVVPIGRPIANTQLYVLDASRQPAPIGAAGELYIGGAGLAHGYINRPDLTAERFVAHPFSAEPGARLYRTGDRVRYLRDGNVEFLGRVDDQVKIRGVRIEPGEIEGVLRRHSAVREAVAVAREDAPGDRRLVAYLVARQQPAPSNGELRRFLSEALPEPMVPSTFVWLDALPLNASGKIDRQRLPAPSALRPDLPEAFIAPRTAVEETIARIWSEVLRRDHIGIHDNFFDLGGHSLLATQVISRIRAVHGKELSLRALFETPTVAGLAARLAADKTAEHSGASATADAGTGTPCVVALQPRGTKTPFFCVHGIGGEVQAYAALARLLDPDRPFFGLRTSELSSADGFPSIEAIATRYVAEMRKTVPAGPYIIGGYSFGATVAFEMAQQVTASGEEIAMVVVLDSGLPNNRRSGRVSPRAVMRYLRNLPWWVIDDLMQTSRAEMAARLRSKATLLAVRLAAVPGLRWLPHRQTDIRDALGMPTVAQEFATFLEQHFKSLVAYLPRAYPGRVVLVKARAMALSRLSEPDFGWGKMAKGGVEIKVVPGSHDNILREPYVRGLADSLRSALDEAEKKARALS